VKTEKLQKRIKEPSVPENGSQFAVVFHRKKDGPFSQKKKNSNLPSINFFLGGLVVYISNLYDNLFFLVCNLWNQKDIYLFIQFFLVLRWKWEKSSTFYQAFS